MALEELPGIFIENSGFDCLLGNPPWESVQPEEKQFFNSCQPDIASKEGAERKKLIDDLQTKNLPLFTKWKDYVRSKDLQVKFIKSSGRFSFQKGKVNLYSAFAELARTILAHSGRAGIIVQSGIATDEGNKDLFSRNHSFE